MDRDGPEPLNSYEPQGELSGESHRQMDPALNFEIPTPTLHADQASGVSGSRASAAAESSAKSAPAERSTTLSGMKRKSNAEGAHLTGADSHLSKRLHASPSLSPTRDEPNRTASTNIEGQSRRAPTAAAQTAEPRKLAGSGSTTTSILPPGMVFPIQIGSELFRLSGVSISSDAPSYFSHYFADQLRRSNGRSSDVKTLYIDRDPNTFRDISLHLQGYHVEPRDGEHYVRLFADAQFYSLPRLTQRLFKSDIHIQIGHRHFRVPRDLFSAPGDSPNFFTLGFANFLSTPTDVFPGLDRASLLRPPTISPPVLPNKSGDIFADLIHFLQGYPVHIRDEGHRSDLLNDARWFRFRGLEQRLIPCTTSFNTFRGVSEILVRLEDIRPAGVTVLLEIGSRGGATEATAPSIDEIAGGQPAVVCYSRPFIDEPASQLILEIGSSETTQLCPPPAGLLEQDIRLLFSNPDVSQMASLLTAISRQVRQPPNRMLSALYEGGLRVRWNRDAWVEFNGVAVELRKAEDESLHVSHRRLDGVYGQGAPYGALLAGDMIFEPMEWVVKRGHWRIIVEQNADGLEVVLCIVRLEAYSSEALGNRARGFLGS